MSERIKRYNNSAGLVRWKVSAQLNGIRIRKQNFFSKKEAVSYLDKVRMLIISDCYEKYQQDELESKRVLKDISLNEYFLSVFSKSKCKDLRESTKHRYKIAMNQHVLKFIGKKSLRSIVSDDFSNIKERMISAGYASSTVNQPIAALIYLLKKASGESLIDSVPKNTVSFRISRRNVFLTDDELAKVLRSIDTELSEKQFWFKVFVHLQLNTFSRIGEMIALNWSDIDFERKTVSIHKQYCSVTKECTPTKNGKTHKAFQLNDEMISLLRVYKLRCGSCPILFPIAHYFSAASNKKLKIRNSNRHIARMRKSGVDRMFKIVAGYTGIESKRLSSHSLRKTGGDRLLRNGFSIHQVAYALRIDPKTVLFTYSTVDEKAFCEKLQNFRLLLSAEQTPMNDNIEEINEGKNE